MPKFRKHSVYRSFVRTERDIPDVSLAPSPTQSQQRLARLEREDRSRSLSVREFLETADRLMNDRETGGHKGALKATALLDIQRRLGSFREADFSNPQARAAYRFLRAQQELYERQRSEKKVQPAAGNKSYYNPAGKDFASNKYGGIARLGAFVQAGFVPHFLNPSSALPCIARVVRREVMFATKKAGKGYKVRHRRNWSSGIPC